MTTYCPHCASIIEDVMATTDGKLVKIRDGEVVLYQRVGSTMWQARYKLPDNKWHRISTKRTAKGEAIRVAGAAYDKARFRHSEGLNAVSRRFRDVAKIAKDKMDLAMKAGKGKRTYRDYVQAIDNYLIPFFGAKHIDKITPDVISQFDAWRVEAMGKEPAASTLSNHNAALNRVFDVALQEGWVQQKNVPVLKNEGKKGKRRPAFTRDEWVKIRNNLRHYVNKTNVERSKFIRELMWDYVLILANTGMRTGTEAYNLKWKQVRWSKTPAGEPCLVISPSGKTGARDLVARRGTEEYFQRLQSRIEELKDIPFDVLLKQRREEYVFRMRDGKRTKNLFNVFNKFLTDIGLLKDQHGNNRSLYSLRHMYATMRLVEDGVSVAQLADQMGTSLQMIDQHYSHLTALMVADKLIGKKYEPKPKKKTTTSKSSQKSDPKSVKSKTKRINNN